MRSTFARFAVAAVTAATAATLAMGTAPAFAAVTPHAVHTDAQGLAGYYLNNDGHSRFRDVRTIFTVTSEMEQLNHGGSFGAAGVQLCNPNDGAMFQAGVIWTGSAFQAVTANGHASTGPDVCVNGAADLQSHIHPMPGNVNAQGIFVGDQIRVEEYYSQTRHRVLATLTDLTQDTASQSPCFAGTQNFREAGVGVLDEAFDTLAPPTANVVTTFSASRVTNYLAKKSGTSLLGHGDLQAVSTLNSSTVPVVVPGALGSGTTFTVKAGVNV